MGTGSGNVMIVITKSPVRVMFSNTLREDMFSCRLHARFVQRQSPGAKSPYEIEAQKSVLINYIYFGVAY